MQVTRICVVCAITFLSLYGALKFILAWRMGAYQGMYPRPPEFVYSFLYEWDKAFYWTGSGMLIAAIAVVTAILLLTTLPTLLSLMRKRWRRS